MGQIKKIDSLINDIKSGNNEVVRIKYMPYSEKIAKMVWFGIARKLIKNIQIECQIKSTWRQLIKYVHADDSCEYDLTKSICLMGKTGSGKSKTMHILNDYISIDQVRFFRNGKNVPFSFNIYSAREIVMDFNNSGYDGIAKYMIYSNICIDDIGTESKEAVYFGTRLNVIPEIIETRYAKGLTTHFTTNLNLDKLRDYYNDRVHSRISEKCNVIILNDKDFRIGDKSKAKNHQNG